MNMYFDGDLVPSFLVHVVWKIFLAKCIASVCLCVCLECLHLLFCFLIYTIWYAFDVNALEISFS